MNLRLFDLHCDTPYEIYKQKTPFDENNLHISLSGASGFGQYAQISAVWSDYALSDEEAYAQFWKIAAAFKDELHKNSIRSCQCVSASDTKAALSLGRCAFILSVEDARLLAGDITRLDSLFCTGVRLLTLVWKGESCIGGAFDTDAPLTPFGRRTVLGCFDIGMTPDVSHSSRSVIDEVIELSKDTGKPFVASHSNSFDICHHPRNLTSGHFRAIKDCGGVVGISLAPQHLTENTDGCRIKDIVPHIEHYMSLGGEHTVCLGCDFDGIDKTPQDIANISHLYRLADALGGLNYSDDQIDRIFFTNAYEFVQKNILK